MSGKNPKNPKKPGKPGTPGKPVNPEISKFISPNYFGNALRVATAAAAVNTSAAFRKASDPFFLSRHYNPHEELYSIFRIREGAGYGIRNGRPINSRAIDNTSPTIVHGIGHSASEANDFPAVYAISRSNPVSMTDFELDPDLRQCALDTTSENYYAKLIVTLIDLGHASILIRCGTKTYSIGILTTGEAETVLQLFASVVQRLVGLPIRTGASMLGSENGPSGSNRSGPNRPVFTGALAMSPDPMAIYKNYTVLAMFPFTIAIYDRLVDYIENNKTSDPVELYYKSAIYTTPSGTKTQSQTYLPIFKIHLKPAFCIFSPPLSRSPVTNCAHSVSQMLKGLVTVQTSANSRSLVASIPENLKHAHGILASPEHTQWLKAPNVQKVIKDWFFNRSPSTPAEVAIMERLNIGIQQSIPTGAAAAAAAETGGAGGRTGTAMTNVTGPSAAVASVASGASAFDDVDVDPDVASGAAAPPSKRGGSQKVRRRLRRKTCRKSKR